MAISVKMGIPADRDPMSDVVNRQQAAARERQDPGDSYEFTSVKVEAGAKDSKTGKRLQIEVKLKWAWDGRYVFAVYSDNPIFMDEERDVWDGAARNALEKFCAIKGVRIKLGPRPEDGNRYNYMTETEKVIDYKPETLATFKEQREAREAYEIEVAEAARMRRLLGVAGR